jgi:hypothetical protein
MPESSLRAYTGNSCRNDENGGALLVLWRSGFGFAFGDWANSYTYADHGARLCFKTSELAEYAGKQFEGIYREFLS